MMKGWWGKIKSIHPSQTLQEQAYQYLYEKIINGEISPGSRLVEQKIVEETKISRSPIRESIRQLESEGLVTVHPRGGVRVYRPTHEDFKHLYECRISFEPTASYYAAHRLNEMRRERLDQIMYSMRSAIELNDTLSLKKYSREFHDTIVEFSGNPYLKKFMNQLRSFVLFYQNAIFNSYDRLLIGSVEHEDIWQAIRNGDGEAAKRLMQDHLKKDYEFYLLEYGKANPKIEKI
ncbi:GntR family transcriptional regulator [Bacillus sp. JJ1532]|uniref:GntR family transcriptional regulator n=1 Tax=Bacillus sp. JJ1532 TaxID=3122958 RepID=UPI002FFE5037